VPSQLTVSGPELLRPFDEMNPGKAYPDQVKPPNFPLAARVSALSVTPRTSTRRTTN
jgi:hypothetical protein